MSPEKEIHQIEREKIFVGPVEAVYDPRIRAHCQDPYYKHPKGCPNWNYKEGCPPHVEYFPKVYSPLVYIAAIRLNFSEYLNSKREIHPDWTERALRNPRHWQGHLRSVLHEFLYRELSNRPKLNGDILFNPEAMGVNLFATCANAGMDLERYPEKYVYQIALIANKLSDNQP